MLKLSNLGEGGNVNHDRGTRQRYCECLGLALTVRPEIQLLTSLANTALNSLLSKAGQLLARQKIYNDIV